MTLTHVYNNVNALELYINYDNQIYLIPSSWTQRNRQAYCTHVDPLSSLKHYVLLK